MTLLYCCSEFNENPVCPCNKIESTSGSDRVIVVTCHAGKGSKNSMLKGTTQVEKEQIKGAF